MGGLISDPWGLILVSGGLESDPRGLKPDPMDLKSDPGGLKSDTTVHLYSLVRSTVYGCTLTANISQSEDSIVTTSYCFNMYFIFTFYIMTIISITDLYVPLQ